MKSKKFKINKRKIKKTLKKYLLWMIVGIIGFKAIVFLFKGSIKDAFNMLIGGLIVYLILKSKIK